MPREIYSLSDATRDTMTDNVGPISHGWNKSPQFCYGILSEDKTDPFPPFLGMYVGTLKGSVSTCHWDNELEFARFRYGKPVNVKDSADCFKEKIRMHGATLGKFIEAFADGEFSAEEIKEIEICLDAEERNYQMIRTMLNFRKGLLQK